MAPRASGSSGVAFDTKNEIWAPGACIRATQKVKIALSSAAPLCSGEWRGRTYVIWQIFRERKRVASKKATISE